MIIFTNGVYRARGRNRPSFVHKHARAMAVARACQWRDSTDNTLDWNWPFDWLLSFLSGPSISLGCGRM